MTLFSIHITKAQIKMFNTADLFINGIERSVYRSAKKLSMSAMTFDVLYLLISQAPANISTEDLMSHIWKKKIVGPETVTQRIALLRKALNDNNTVEYIESIRGEGYRWLPAVYPAQAKKQSFIRKHLKTFMIILVIVAMCGLFWTMRQPSGGNSSTLQNSSQSPNYLDPMQQLLNQADRYYKRFTEKDTQQALIFYQKAYTLSPDSVQAMVGLSKSYSQMVSKYHASDKLLKQAEQLAQKAVTAAPDDFSALSALGFSLDVQGQKNKAIKMYEKALMIEPNNKQLMGGIAYLYGISGNLVESLRLNVLALAGEQNYRHLQTAKILHLLGFNVVADRWYQTADELNPDSVFAANDRAEFYFSQTQLQRAKNILNKALNREIKRMEPHLLLGQIAYLNNDQTLAEEEFKLAELIDPQSTTPKIWSLWLKSQSTEPLNPADILQLNQLENDLQETVKQGDYWPQAHIDLALLAISKNQPNNAIEQLRLAFEGGFLRADLLLQTPAVQSIKQYPAFINLIESMRTEVKRQRTLVSSAQWLPEGFLDPGNH